MAYKNKIDQKLCAQKHYQLNKKKMVAKAAINNEAAKKRNKEYVKNYLLSHPCIDCNEHDIIVLEFDHISDNKELSVSNAIHRPCSLKNLINEINKCVVRCANCHRRVTHFRRLEDAKGPRQKKRSRTISLTLFE